MTTSNQWRHPAFWWRLGVSLVCAAVSLWAVLRLTVRSLERQAIWTDFALFHATVNRWLDGLPMYGRAIPMFGAPRITESVNFNPPQFHLLVLPFAHLELWPGLLLWQALSLLAGCAAAAIVVRTLGLGWSTLPAMLAAAILLNSAALSSTVVVRADIAVPGHSGHTGLASAPFAAVDATGRVDGNRGEHQAVPPDRLSLSAAQAPVARRGVGRRRVGAELRGGHCGLRPRCAGAVVRGGTVAKLGGTLPQCIIPGIRLARDVGVARGDRRLDRVRRGPSGHRLDRQQARR